MIYQLIEFIPLLLVGFLIGCFKGLKAEAARQDSEDKSVTSKWQVALSCVLEGGTGAVIVFICYGLLSVWQLPYIFKCCAGACVVFLGMDKALELIERFFRLRK